MRAPADDRVHRAKDISIEDECLRRGIRLRGQRPHRYGPCPQCGGEDRFSIHTRKQIFRCRQCNEKGGDIITFVQWLDGCDFPTALTTLAGEPAPRPSSNPNGAHPAETWSWVYRDADEHDYLKVTRRQDLNGKSYPQAHWNGSKWATGKPKGPKIPYRLPELLDSDRSEPVYITEGEKCADAVAKLGLAATTASEGAGKWTPDLDHWFTGRIVRILPDNDKPGLEHAEQVARRLAEVAQSVRVILLPGLAIGEDVYDWLAKGGTAEQLDQLGDTTPEFDPCGAFWHGEVELVDSRKWLIAGTLPETGAGLLSGQWGLYKTFLAIDISAAVISGTRIFDCDIDRQGGVLLHAAEGESEVAVRLDAAIRHRCPQFAERAPFAWFTAEKLSLTLLDQASVGEFIKRAKAVDKRMRKQFGLPLALIIIDTVVATAGYKKSGDESDSALGTQLMQACKRISRETGTFVLGVDHFGKLAETGTRGTSAKEDNADAVLAALGERTLAGTVSNPRLAIRKVRGGAAGKEYAFTVAETRLDKLDPLGREIATLRIEWQPNQQDAAPARTAWPKTIRLLRRVLETLHDRGKDLQPWADGPTIRAIDKEIARSEFYKQHAADGDTPEKRQAAKRQAFNRAIETAQAKELIGVREINETQYLWLASK